MLAVVVMMKKDACDNGGDRDVADLADEESHYHGYDRFVSLLCNRLVLRARDCKTRKATPKPTSSNRTTSTLKSLKSRTEALGSKSSTTKPSELHAFEPRMCVKKANPEPYLPAFTLNFLYGHAMINLDKASSIGCEALNPNILRPESAFSGDR